MKIAQVSMGSSVQLTIGGRKSEYLSLNAKNANVDIEFSQGVFTVTCLATRKKTCFGLTNAKWWDPLEVEDAAELTEHASPFGTTVTHAEHAFEAVTPTGVIETETPKRRGRPPKA